MERRINGNEEYFDEKELLSLHQSTKGEAIKKVLKNMSNRKIC